MNFLFFKNTTLAMFAIALLLLALLSSSMALGADKAPVIATGEIIAELKTKLNLNDKQVKDLTAALTELSVQLDKVITAREAARDEDDPSAFIQGVKQAQAVYKSKLATILSADQQASYDTLRETVINDIMTDLAEIKLLDIKPHVQFSDEQMQQLIPVLMGSMRDFMKIAWEHAGKTLPVRQKIKIAKSLKKIQSDAQQQAMLILTPTQFNKWEAYKEEQRAKKNKS